MNKARVHSDTDEHHTKTLPTVNASHEWQPQHRYRVVAGAPGHHLNSVPPLPHYNTATTSKFTLKNLLRNQ